MKVYIAGPMRGIKHFNFPEFYRAADVWRTHGHEVFCPAEQDVLVDGFDPAGDVELEQRHYARRDCLAIIEQCDTVYALKGWSRSMGARAEVALALWIGCTVVCEDPEEGAALICADGTEGGGGTYGI